MDPLYVALNLFRRRKFEECVDVCTESLQKNPYDQVGKCNVWLAWNFKVRPKTKQH